MISRILGVVLCCVFTTGAAASSYSDFNAGIAAFRRRDFDGASAHMTAALAAPDLNPAFRAPAHFIRGEVYSAKGQWQGVIDEATAALAADPQYLDAYEIRADAYRRLGQSGPLIADLTAIVNAKPFLVESYYWRAGVYLDERDFVSAINDYNRVVMIAPGEPASYIARGGAYRLGGDLPHALDDLNKAVDLASKSPDPLVERSLVYEAMADYARAKNDLEAAAHLSPDNMMVAMNRGFNAWDSGDFAAAIKFFQTVRDSTYQRFVPYAAIWGAIATLANHGSDADAAKAAAVAFDRKKWPGPVLDLYTGGSSVDALTKAAAVGDVQSRSGHGCEASFYAGEWLVLHGNMAVGKPLIASAVTNCPPDFIEHAAAVVAYRHLP